MNVNREEYPRPQFERREWLNLNGEWEFEIDNSNSGFERNLHLGEALSQRIMVPFCPESRLSGLEHKDFMLSVWYKKNITIPKEWMTSNKLVFLNIGACDYYTKVWVNGNLVGEHLGGYTPMSFDITNVLKNGENIITVNAQDDVRSGRQPVGKQSKLYYSKWCSYTRTTGIWQTVWLESVPKKHIIGVKCTPDIKKNVLYINAECDCKDGDEITATAYYQGKKVGECNGEVICKRADMVLELSEQHLWDVGCGELYDLELILAEDTVKSYFGMREVYYKDRSLHINGRPVFQRLVLDQGFYPEGIYTAPNDDELKNDILRSMAMGFNGARLHQKVFEPRFLYHCDKLGYIVWGEHASWGLDLSDAYAWRGIVPEWFEIIKRDYNHPSIIGWCPLNETIKTQDVELIKCLYNMTKAFDATRPVIDCSGYTHCITDVWDAHDYIQDACVMSKTYEPLLSGGKVEVPDMGVYPPELSFISEYGGIGWRIGANEKAWGYGNEPKSENEFLQRFKDLTLTLYANPRITAVCYTQLTDVEQEINGLYTYDRIAKFSPDCIKSIVTLKAAIEE